MARIAGVNIPTAKRVVVGLQYIHGIGQAKAKEILGKVGIDESRRVNTLTRIRAAVPASIAHANGAASHRYTRCHSPVR